MKKKFSKITVLLIVVITIILMIIASIIIFNMNKKPTTDVRVSIYGENTIITNTLKPYVYDNKISDNEFKVPYINLNTEYATEANSEIDGIYTTLKEGDTRQNGDPWYNTMSYTSEVNGNILSIVIIIQHLGTDTPSTDYKVFNINIKSGNAVTNDELIKYIKSNENKVKSKFIEQIKTKVSEKYNAADKDKYITKSTDSFTQNFNDVQMFLSKGKLKGISTIFIPVGVEKFYEIIEIN